MLKLKGKEFPVSILKVCLTDATLDQLTWIKKYLKMPSDALTLNIIINNAFQVLKQHDDYLNSEGVLVNTSLSRQRITEGSATSDKVVINKVTAADKNERT